MIVPDAKNLPAEMAMFLGARLGRQPPQRLKALHPVVR